MIVEIKDEDYLYKNEEIILNMENNQSNTPFQYYGWLNNALNELRRNPLKKIGFERRFAVLKDNQEILAVAPIIVKKIGNKKGVLIWGYDIASDYLDFLYLRDLDTDHIAFFINEILRLTKETHFYFSGVLKESCTAKALLNSKEFCLLSEKRCVHILLNYESYDQYFSSLSKSVRQNIRTANNRLKNDKKLGNINIYDNNINEGLAEKLQAIYEKRRKEQNIKRTDIRYRILTKRRMIGLKNYNYMKQSMIENKDSYIIVYTIDNEVAAFGHALRKKSGDYLFMQVSYLDQFRHYSPGILMFNEFIRYKFTNRIEGNIDLTIGTEKYKYDLGGVEHLAIYGTYIKHD